MVQGTPNVARWERWASSLAGAALLIVAARRPLLTAAVIAAGGMLLLGRGMTGRCPLYRALGVSTLRPAADETHLVDAASDMSFPASDPPAWSPTAAGGPATVS